MYANAAVDRPPVAFRGKTFRSSKVFRAGTHRARSPEDTLASIRPFFRRVGVTRIADITGLDHVGVPTTLAVRPNAMTLACSSGKGVTLDQAYVSGAMEAFELYAAETANIPSIRASYRDLSRQYPLPPAPDLPLRRWNLFTDEWPFYWCMGWDLITQSEFPVPMAMVGMSRKHMAFSLGAFLVTSNGLGAGNSFLEAVAAGLYEVIERDAVACQFHAATRKGHVIPAVSMKMMLNYPMVADVLDKCNRAGVRVSAMDNTADTKVPTYVAHVYDIIEQGVAVTRGSGSHLDPEIALLRAITEALQGRLNFIAGSRDDIFRSAYGRYQTESPHTIRVLEYAQSSSPEAGLIESRASATFEDDINELLSCLQAAGLQNVVVVDLTPPELPVYVVRVVVPGLEGYMRHGYSPGRRALNYYGNVGAP